MLIYKKSRQGEKMKKLISIIALMLCVLMLASCEINIASQLESISNQIYDIAAGAGGDYLKETTSLPESSSSSSSSTSTAKPEDKPEPEPEPEPEVPTRTAPTVDQMMGININVDIKSSGNPLAVNNPFATARVSVKDLGTGVNTAGVKYLSNAGSYCDTRTMLGLDFALDSLVEGTDDSTHQQRIIASAELISDYYTTYSASDGAYIRYIEAGKHPDLYVGTDDYSYFLNFAYDGNRGFESGLGIVNTENGRGAKLVVGPLSTPNAMFMFNTLHSLSEIRDGETPLKAVGAVATDAFIPSSVTPESQYLDSNNQLVQMVKMRDTSYSHIQIFVSNFGYNTKDSESDYYVSEQRQADYLIRSYLLFAGLGIDNATICQYKDATGSEYDGFGTLGSTEIPKLSQYYLYAFSKILEGYTFVDSVENEKDALIYCFEHEDGSVIYAVWNGVNDGSVISDVKILTDRSATIITLPDEYSSGNEVRQRADEDGFITVNASETPIFVRVSPPEVEPEPPVRVIPTVNQLMDVFLNFDLPSNKTNTLATNNPFGAMTIGGTHNTTSNKIEIASGRITIAKGFYGIEPTIKMGVDLSKAVATNPENLTGVWTYLQLAGITKDTQATYGNTLTAGAYRLEIGSKPDTTMNASDYALLISLAYDGNRGEIAGTGVMSTAYSSQTKLFTGSFSAPNSTYMKDLLEGISYHREREVILALRGINTLAFAPSSMSPESFYLAEDSELLKMVALRDASYKYIEINVSGFGYNTKDTESDYYVTEQVQANYLVRSYLIFAGMGIDRATICQYKDEAGSEYDGFGTLNEDGTEKLSQYYLAIMSKALNGYTFSKTIENEYGAYIYEFKNENGDTVYAVWSDGATITGVEIEVGDAEVGIVSLTNAYSYDQQSATKDGTKVTVDATETPVFVKVPAPAVTPEE